MAQRKLRIIRAIRQDKNINAIRVAIRVGIRGIIADVVVSLVSIQVARLRVVVQSVRNMDIGPGSGTA